jgi:hypothetical protein
MPLKMMNRYTCLARLKNEKWLEHKIIKLMDPARTANNFRDFLRQICKYLQDQDKEEQIETQGMIKRKLAFIKAYKKVVKVR